jgi:hypothetical protein
MPGIKDSQLASPIAKDLDDLGVGYFRFDGAAQLGDDVVIATGGGATETWTASSGGAGAGEFDLDGGTQASCAASLADKINALPESLVRAIVRDIIVIVFAKDATAGNLTLASTSGGRIVPSAAAMVGSAVSDVSQRSIGQYALTAEDVTTMAPAPGLAQEIVVGAFATTTEPKLLGASFRTAAGEFYSPATLQLAFVQSGANEWSLLLSEKGAAAVLSATDVVTFEVGF